MCRCKHHFDYAKSSSRNTSPLSRDPADHCLWAFLRKATTPIFFALNIEAETVW
jgi:hypothetical protein